MPAPAQEKVLVPLVLDHSMRDPIAMFPARDAEENAVAADPFLAGAEGLVQPAVYGALTSAVRKRDDGTAVLRFRDIQAAGLRIRFDDATLELYADVPPEARKTSVIDLAPRVRARGEPVPPSSFSAFVNIYANQEYAFRDTTFGAKEGRQPFTATLDSAFNWSSFVLEGSAHYVETATASPWTRSDVRLIKDYPERMLRFTAGDLNYQTSFFQQFQPMGGISVAKNFNLQPQTLTIPSTQYEFFLRSPAALRVYVNNRLFREMQLEAGSYDVRNLPLATGLNSVRYEIVDTSGKTEALSYPFNTEPESLKKGLSQYSYNLGFVSAPGKSTYRYHSDRFAVSAFHRYGFSHLVTAGLSFQNEDKVSVGGIDAVLATNAGTFSLDGAFSRIHGGDSDYAGRFRYLYRDFYGEEQTQRTFLLSADTRGRRFASLGNPGPNNPVAHNLTANFSQQVLGMGMGLGGDYSFYRRISELTRDSYRINYSLGKSWRSGINGNLVASTGKDSLGRTEKSIFFFLSYQLPKSGQNVTYTMNTPNQSHRVDWRYIDRTGRLTLNTATETNEASKSVESQVFYSGARGDLTVAQQAVNSITGDRQMIGRLRLASAIVFADGVFGWSRPVSDSFALVTRPPDWGDETIDINPDTNGSYAAQINNWGPAVVPALASYTPYRLHADASRLTPGLSLQSDDFLVNPTYKSGTLIRVGSNASVAAIGTVIDRNGEALSLALIYIHSTDAPHEVPIEVFTNREGRFQAEGLKPGKYEIRGLPLLRTPVPFSIPEGSRGILDLGEMREP